MSSRPKPSANGRPRHAFFASFTPVGVASVSPHAGGRPEHAAHAWRRVGRGIDKEFSNEMLSRIFFFQFGQTNYYEQPQKPHLLAVQSQERRGTLNPCVAATPTWRSSCRGRAFPPDLFYLYMRRARANTQTLCSHPGKFTCEAAGQYIYHR